MESCYPVFYNYGKYSVRFSELSKDDLVWLQNRVKERTCLKCNGVNF